jgi:site-specific recombinase XerD
MLFRDIKRKELVDFFAWLQEEYISNPDGVAPRNEKPLAPKTIRNIHTNLSALWTWAVEEDFVQKNVAQEIDKPPASPPVVEPYTKEDVAAIYFATAKPIPVLPPVTKVTLLANFIKSLLFFTGGE